MGIPNTFLWSVAVGVLSTAGLFAVHAQDRFAFSPKPIQAARDEPTRIVVKFQPAADGLDAASLLGSLLTNDTTARWQPAHLEALFERTGTRSNARSSGLAQLARTFVSDIPAGMTATHAAERVAKDPRVEYAQPDYVRETHTAPADPFYNSSGSWEQPYRDQWGLVKLELENAWDYLTTEIGTSLSENVTVAVVDTGIDRTHPDLSLGQGWDFVSNDDDPQDTYGHGTHVAGVVAARRDNLIDGRVFGMTGVAGPRLMPVRVIAGAGRGNSSTVASGIAFAADNGADVIALTSGCTSRCPSDPVVESAVRYAIARGAIVVTSAGNRGDDIAFYSPQNMLDPRPIVMAASDQLDHRESFSNFGNFVDLIAPGGGTNVAPPDFQPVSNILSLASSTCSPLFCVDALRVGSGQFLRRAGTSLSAAYAAGVAALVLAESPILTIDGVRERLFGNALDRGPGGHDVLYGWGRLTGTNSTIGLRRYILARILSPARGATVKGSVRIVGAATATSFDRYEIFVGEGTAPPTWRTTGIFKYGRPTPQGDLARWNTRGLTPGPWTIRLVVHDTLGGSREVRRTVTVEKNAAQALIVDVASTGGGEGSVQVDPLGTTCGGIARSTLSCEYANAGTTLTLTPLPRANSIFTGWSGACSGTGPCAVLVKGLRTVRADFQGPYRLQVKLQFEHDGQGGVFVDPPGVECRRFAPCPVQSYPPGTSVTLQGSAEEPFGSFGWGPGPCEGQGQNCALVMNRDVVANATIENFEDTFLASASVDRERVPLGTSVQLFGFASQVGNPGNFNYAWFDETTGTFLGNTPNPSVNLAPLGAHLLSFTATTLDEPSESRSDNVWVIVTDP